jgi:hypothetical protein
MSPDFANLRKCIYSTPEDLERLRAIVVNNVMATDIFDKDLNAIRRSRWEKAFANKDGANREIGTGNHEEDINRKATVVMERLLQASDVSHTMQHWVSNFPLQQHLSEKNGLHSRQTQLSHSM